jgi:hypothetical protein
MLFEQSEFIEYLKKLVCVPLSSARQRFFLILLSSAKKEE